jgi:hypothetical protein
MTIAVGFRCRDGVVLVADGEVCLGPGGKKYEAQFCEVGVAGSVSLLSTGNADRFAELAAALRRAIRGKTGSKLTKSVEAVCRSFWTQGSPDPWERAKAFGDLLVTIDAGNGILLFRAGNHHFERVETYSVLGVEAEKTRPVFERLYDRALDAASGAYMGIYALSQIKGTVPGCGGETRVWKITDSVFHRHSFSEEHIHKTENTYRRFEVELARLLFKFPDPTVSKDQFRNHEKKFSAAIKKLRKEMDEKEESGNRTSTRAATKRRRPSIAAKSVLPFAILQACENAPVALDPADRGYASTGST